MLIKTKAAIVTIVLLATAVIIMQRDQETSDNKGQSSLTKVNDKFSSMKSIAQPNWWVKSTHTAIPNIKPKAPQKHTKRVSKNSEPVSNFIILPNMDNWLLQKSTKGIASATYRFNDPQIKNKHYELAIIRMNANVALNDVLSIWQNKVALPSKQPSKSLMFTTKQKQQLDLFTFKGAQKIILVAVHKKHKYTFFRLASIRQNNQQSNQENTLASDKKIEQIFKNFLTDIYINN